MVKSDSTVSDPPKQKMVCAVIPSDCFTAIGQSKILVTVTAGYDQVVGFRRKVGRSSAARGVAPMEVSVGRVDTLRLVTWEMCLGVKISHTDFHV